MVLAYVYSTQNIFADPILQPVDYGPVQHVQPSLLHHDWPQGIRQFRVQGAEDARGRRSAVWRTDRSAGQDDEQDWGGLSVRDRGFVVCSSFWLLDCFLLGVFGLRAFV